MGWTDSHLHGFRITKNGTSQPIIVQYPNPEADLGFGEDERDERREKIADYFGILIKQCVYEYDFGDGWMHTMLFERELPTEPGAEYPQCIAGENACPPEDCGGLGGYDRLQKIMKKPKHPEHASMLEWLGLDSADEFDSSEFDPQAVEFGDPRKQLNQLKQYKRGFSV